MAAFLSDTVAESFVREMTNCPIAGRGLRIAEQGSGERGPLLVHRRLDIEAGFGEAREQIRFRVEPVVCLRHTIDDDRIDAEGFAGLAQRAARAIGRHGGGQRSPVAAVLPLDVLHHFFAPLLLEIDVDIASGRTLPTAFLNRVGPKCWPLSSAYLPRQRI